MIFIKKHLIFFAIFLLLIVTQPLQSNTEAASQLQILFVGNSYTFQNDLPQTLEEMLNESGYQAEIEMQANPAWSLLKHAQSEYAIDKIKSRRWDYVILQEQSVIPALSKSRKTKMIPAVRQLSSLNKGTTILFMTWGRKNGFKNFNFNKFEDMQEKLTQGYIEVARQFQLPVAPVGEAFKEARQQKPFFPLWNADGSHPSISGSYLSACVFFSLITNESPVGNTYQPKLSAESTLFLQKVAQKVTTEQDWNNL